MWKYECVCVRAIAQERQWLIWLRLICWPHKRCVVCWTGETCLTKFTLNFLMTFITTNKIFPLTWQCLKFIKLSKILSCTIVNKKNKSGKYTKFLFAYLSNGDIESTVNNFNRNGQRNLFRDYLPHLSIYARIWTMLREASGKNFTLHIFFLLCSLVHVTRSWS